MSAPARKLVLVVEDEPDSLHTYALLLRHAGYDVLTADHPGAALQLLKEEHKPQLVLTDFMMPWMDGRSFARQLKADAGMRGVPVLLMSAVEPGEGPWDGFLRKPVDYATLLAAIKRFLPE